jgi:hypothetical protein
MNRMSPLKIEILLHYYCLSGDYDIERLGAPAQSSAVAEFIELGLLRHSERPGQKYEGVSGALKPYVEALCAVPLPQQQWVIPS